MLILYIFKNRMIKMTVMKEEITSKEIEISKRI
jgi:hypothetical protein